MIKRPQTSFRLLGRRATRGAILSLLCLFLWSRFVKWEVLAPVPLRNFPRVFELRDKGCQGNSAGAVRAATSPRGSARTDFVDMSLSGFHAATSATKPPL
jgi:hypothetical protein